MVGRTALSQRWRAERHARASLFVDAHRDMLAHRYVWAFRVYASVVNVDAHRGMLAHRCLWARLVESF